MSGRHAVKFGEPSWSEQQRAPELDLLTYQAGLTAAPAADLPMGHGSSGFPRRPAPHMLTVAQFVTWMQATHQPVWGRICKCGVGDCVYLDAVMRLGSGGEVHVARFMDWMAAGHQRMPAGCSCGVAGCEYRVRLDWVDAHLRATRDDGRAFRTRAGSS